MVCVRVPIRAAINMYIFNSDIVLPQKLQFSMNNIYITSTSTAAVRVNGIVYCICICYSMRHIRQ